MDVTFDEEVAFKRSKDSHMDIHSEEQEASKDAGPIIPDVYTFDYQDDPVEPMELAVLVDMHRKAVVTRKRPT